MPSLQANRKEMLEFVYIILRYTAIWNQLKAYPLKGLSTIIFGDKSSNGSQCSDEATVRRYPNRQASKSDYCLST